MSANPIHDQLVAEWPALYAERIVSVAWPRCDATHDEAGYTLPIVCQRDLGHEGRHEAACHWPGPDRVTDTWLW